MKRPLGWVAAAAIVVLCFVGWLKFIHDPAVRARAALEARDAVTDSLVAAWQDSARVWAKRDSARVQTIAGLRATVVALQAEQPQLRTATNTIVASVADTAVRRQLLEALAKERANSDRIHEADSLRIQELELLAESRLVLLNQAQTTIADLDETRKQWRKAAGGRSVGVACTVGPTASTNGVSPVGVTCGVSIRIW